MGDNFLLFYDAPSLVSRGKITGRIRKIGKKILKISHF